jgi:hypothetical protein
MLLALSAALDHGNTAGATTILRMLAQILEGRIPTGSCFLLTDSHSQYSPHAGMVNPCQGRWHQLHDQIKEGDATSSKPHCAIVAIGIVGNMAVFIVVMDAGLPLIPPAIGSVQDEQNPSAMALPAPAGFPPLQS